MLTRRSMLPLLGTPILSLLPQIDAYAGDKSKLNNEKALIVIPLAGGPSQIETFDIHPEATGDFQSLTGFIKTNVEGICLGGNFVNLAKIADKFSVVNGISHGDSTHDSGFCACMTAYNVPSSDNAMQKEPSYGSIISNVFGANTVNGMPSYITTERIRHSSGAWMGIKTESFVMSEDGVKNLNLNMAQERFNSRLKFIETIESSNKLSSHSLMKGWSELRGLAANTVRGDVAKSFKVELESEKMREKYGVGKSNFGKNLLLARRLIQGGSKVIVVQSQNWDTHSGLAQTFSSNAAELDLYLSILVEDLIQQGMYKDVMIFLTGEFGRTPRLNTSQPLPGRDHHSNSMSSLILGGDFNHGRRIGLTTKDTATPMNKAITHMDLLATTLGHFGINEKIVVTDSLSRPHHILSGEYSHLL